MTSTAKSLIAAGLASRVLVQLSYAIGVAEPLSIFVDSYGTSKVSDEELTEIVKANWDLRPGVIGKSLAASQKIVSTCFTQSRSSAYKSPFTVVRPVTVTVSIVLTEEHCVSRVHPLHSRQL